MPTGAIPDACTYRVCIPQRDFNVFVVNAFDTGKAAKYLGVPGGTSLRNILQREFKVIKNERMSTCDWSRR